MPTPPKSPPLPALSWDPEVLRDTVQKAKGQIRGRMKALRSGFGATSLATRSQKIVTALLALPEMEQASSVALFWPMIQRGEIDLRPLDEALRAAQKKIYYPFMRPTAQGSFQTGFGLCPNVTDLLPSSQGFLQPKEGPVAGRGDIDLVLVPALAADQSGHRIGYGAGYYDATLSDVCPPARAVIVVYQFQMLAELPREAHDQACDLIITDEHSYRAI